MDKTKFIYIKKKFMHCSKIYPSDSLRKSCTYKDHGRLFAVGECYDKKTSRG